MVPFFSPPGAPFFSPRRPAGCFPGFKHTFLHMGTNCDPGAKAILGTLTFRKEGFITKLGACRPDPLPFLFPFLYRFCLPMGPFFSAFWWSAGANKNGIKTPKIGVKKNGKKMVFPFFFGTKPPWAPHPWRTQFSGFLDIVWQFWAPGLIPLDS